MNGRIMRVSAAIAIAAMCIAFAGAAIAEEIAIIVHKTNSENFSSDSLRNYFAGRKTHFENGIEVVIVDHAASSKARPTFLQKVVAMTADAWGQHWLEQKSKSGRAKPKQTKSVKFIIRLISRKPGAIGYVSAGDLDAKSRTLVRIVSTVK